jgi:outer membrane protein OmpA-like peptidoglycan-associated protein
MKRKLFLISLVLSFMGCSTNSLIKISVIDKNLLGLKIEQTIDGVRITSEDSVLYEVGSYELSSSGNIFLDQISQILLNKTAANILIIGHTDNTGNGQANALLSDQRAKVVKDALVNRKIPIERMISKGYGSSQPIADNVTSEGRRINRRSEIIILGETIDQINKIP